MKINHKVKNQLDNTEHGFNLYWLLTLPDYLSYSEHPDCFEQLEVLERVVDLLENGEAEQRYGIKLEPPSFRVLLIYLIWLGYLISSTVLDGGEELKDIINQEQNVYNKVDVPVDLDEVE